MTAEDLRVLYETELREELDDLRRPYDERMGLWGLLCESRRSEPGELREEDHPNVWVWSDLHLGHAPTIGVFGRPYATPEEMDDELFGAWWQVVAPGDTIVNLGDLTPGGLSGRRLRRLRAAPGRKILILGNHEFVRGGLVGVEGFDEVYSTLYIAGRPELLLTHLPLRVVPEGSVNVHGHVHKSVPWGTRRINVTVEQLHYRPRSLTEIRRLAGRFVRREVVPGRTTAEQLEHVG